MKRFGGSVITDELPVTGIRIVDETTFRGIDFSKIAATALPLSPRANPTTTTPNAVVAITTAATRRSKRRFGRSTPATSSYTRTCSGN